MLRLRDKYQWKRKHSGKVESILEKRKTESLSKEKNGESLIWIATPYRSTAWTITAKTAMEMLEAYEEMWPWRKLAYSSWRN